MESKVPYFTLNNGVKMPGIGKGCWLGEGGGRDVAKEMCLNALKCGYRHLDTAPGYNNEELVGEAIRESGIPRSEIFVTTKLTNFRDVQGSFESSLSRLGCGYIDLYLIHWPQMHESGAGPWTPGRILPFEEHPNFVDAWKEMEKLYESGKVRAIGISNFGPRNIERLLENARIVPAVNQVEAHPCLPRFELQSFCAAKGILLSAYSPLGMGNPLYFTDPDITRVATAHNASPAQVALTWLVRRGVVPVVKSANPVRMRANLTLLELGEEEMRGVGEVWRKPGMHRSLINYHDPEGKTFGWTYEELDWPLDVGGVGRV